MGYLNVFGLLGIIFFRKAFFLLRPYSPYAVAFDGKAFFVFLVGLLGIRIGMPRLYVLLRIYEGSIKVLLRPYKDFVRALGPQGLSGVAAFSANARALGPLGF